MNDFLACDSDSRKCPRVGRVVRGGHDTKRAAVNAALAGYIDLCRRRELQS